jgi:ABC-2 type transport system ATP-binding protein
VSAIRAQGLVKRFESTLALDHVELSVAEGEVRGLLGPNGAGKTTLLRILFGLIQPDAGSVELFDRPLRRSAQSALGNVAGFVEDPAFYPYLSGRANLELLATLDGGAAEARIDDALARVGLGERGGDRVSGYSTGMRQRLGIAASLLRSPRLLLLDEPTAGLDPAGVREMGALVRELAADGVAILVSSHQIVEVEDVCDTFTILRRGKVVWSGSAPQLREAAPGSGYALSTSDDRMALQIASQHEGVDAIEAQAGGIALSAGAAALDGYVLALGEARIAVRRLELLISPLESMFFSLTSDGDPLQPTELAQRSLART